MSRLLVTWLFDEHEPVVLTALEWCALPAAYLRNAVAVSVSEADAQAIRDFGDSQRVSLHNERGMSR